MSLVSQPSTDLALFVLGKLVFVYWAIVAPISLHPLGPVALTFALVSTVSGVVLATVFQMAHCVEEAVHLAPPTDQRLSSNMGRRPRPDSTWVAAQVSVSFHPGVRAGR